MTGDESNLLKEAWQSQREEPLVFSAEELRMRSVRLTRQVQLRNSFEYGAAAVIALADGFYMWAFSSILIRAGSALIFAGIFYVVLHLHRRGKAASLHSAAAPSLDFLIAEMERQQNLLWRIWEWYLMPLFPGITVFLFGISVMRQTNGSPIVPERSIVLTATLVVATFALIGFANRRGSRRLQRQIEALKRLQR